MVRRNALQLGDDRFRSDSERLIAAVERALEKTAGERREIEVKDSLQGELPRKEEQEQPEKPRSQSPGPAAAVGASTTPGKKKLWLAAGIMTLLALVICVQALATRVDLVGDSVPRQLGSATVPSVVAIRNSMITSMLRIKI